MEKSRFKAHLLNTKKNIDKEVKSKNALSASGKLKIEIETKDYTRVIEGKNLVVSLASRTMKYMALGQKQISYIEFGDHPSPPIPKLEDVALAQTTGIKKATTQSSHSDNSVLYYAELLEIEGNGLNLSEFGLFSTPFGSGELFARKIIEPFTKTSDKKVKLSWIITFDVGEQSGGGCQGVSVTGAEVMTDDHPYTSDGTETEIVVPFAFAVGKKHLDVFYNGQRLTYNKHYYESNLSGGNGIVIVGFTPEYGKEFYFVHRKLM